ncbi:MAG: hypothetical protein LLG01_05230 [Planctomycetaceae bacterium]|nr:hypothetical protein [Planctomycetaceae bacterium]
MSWLEDKLTPCRSEPQPLWADLYCLLTLATLAVTLPWWQGSHLQTMVWLADQATSPYLPPALAMLLAMRRGAIDMSVWAVAAVGGLAAAVALNTGWSGWSAVGVGIAAGAGIGAFNGLLAVVLRRPVPAITLVVGLLIVLAAWQFGSGREVLVNEEAMEAIQSSQYDSEGLRRLLVSGCFLAVLAGLLNRVLPADHPRRGRWDLLVILSVSGALSACGGVAWVLSHAQAPLPTRVIGDLRVAVAAVLAGGLFLRGPGRSLVCVALLPAAIVVTTAWRQSFFPFLVGGYWAHMLVLLGVVGISQIAVRRVVRGRGAEIGAALAVWFIMCLMGLGLTASAGALRATAATTQSATGVSSAEPRSLKALRVGAMAACTAAAVLLGRAMRRRKDQARG